jgi:peptide/nickel transport system substrate-binding protein
MKIRHFPALVSLVAFTLGTVGLPAQAQSQEKTLRIAASANIKILDPGFTSAYITRNFGYMVYDTLFSQDSKGQPKPQMVSSYEASKDGLNWKFKLRPGLKFSDGAAVTPTDVVASINRWASRDNVGRAMGVAGGEWTVLGADGFMLQLKEPFAPVLEALSKPSSFPLFVMPERLARNPPTRPLDEVMGSGPFIFKKEEWIPGNKLIFVRNPAYVPRSEAPDGLSGGKKPNFARVEWLYLPDTNSAISALKNGEIDMIERVPPDYVAGLRADPNINVKLADSSQGLMVMNQLHPPFDNPKVRRALMMAVDQKKFMSGIGVSVDMRVPHCATYFICGEAGYTDAGSKPYATADLGKAKALLAQSGYKGEKVALLVPTDHPALNAAALVAAQTLRDVGFVVEEKNMTWSNVVARRTKRDLPDAGGWSMYLTVAGQFDLGTPITHAYLAAACGNNSPGWPCDKRLDELRTEWIKTAAPAKRAQVLSQFHEQAFQSVPYINFGQYSAAFAVRKEIKNADKIWAGLPSIWMLDK